ncbi:hypothetical protein [Rhodococcus sp. IEGM 1379]|uniref:hypothetical protein n=1 Tax=Rhodococcus sp. IEGM 1379 TaxID=3047086 RepID=UPI0024B80FAA|nr:hypothetical protein [Rhodococcus sp. IEGM 1379]MDI9915307.1 hypothetical protein [Rhodococcus sp. IEGM 1379]
MTSKQRTVRKAATVAIASAMTVTIGGLTAPAQAATSFDVLCTPTDTGLSELSGLAVSDSRMYAIGDSGADDRIAELDATCQVTRWVSVGAPTVDVEDLDSTADGTLWLADIGDNNKVRSSVALIGFDPDTATATTHPLSYPDGAHDAEALLIQNDGLPVIVTKDYLGSSYVYTPADRTSVHSLDTSVPTPLSKVGHLQFTPTTTPGGPINGAGTMAVTGGAVSKDGTVVALRTYTDVYLYLAPDGDVVKALSTRAIRVPLPNEPQGEAITFNDDGDLISGSEAYQGPLPPLKILRGATAIAESGAGTGSMGSLGSTGS